MIDLSLATEILGVLYEKYFQNHIIGISSRETDRVVKGEKNEISKAIQLLENKYFIENDKGWYRITHNGIDRYEDTLPASSLIKRITERKIILQFLKEIYDKDTSLFAELPEILEKTKNDDSKELWGQMKYMVDKGLVHWQTHTNGFWVQLTVEGAQTFESYERYDHQIMTASYRTLFILENHIRNFIEKKLMIKHGLEWWGKGISQSLQNKIDDRKKEELQFPWIVSSNKNNLEYLSFPDLTKILINQWDVFKEYLKNQNQIELRLNELEEIRNSIGHSRTLTEDSITRLEQYSNDILKMTKN